MISLAQHSRHAPPSLLVGRHDPSPTSRALCSDASTMASPLLRLLTHGSASVGQIPFHRCRNLERSRPRRCLCLGFEGRSTYHRSSSHASAVLFEGISLPAPACTSSFSPVFQYATSRADSIIIATSPRQLHHRSAAASLAAILVVHLASQVATGGERLICFHSVPWYNSR